MRSICAVAAVVSLNNRSANQHYAISQPSDGMYCLTERIDGNYLPISASLLLEDFVREVNAMGSQETC